jgi:hypothetical protein
MKSSYIRNINTQTISSMEISINVISAFFISAINTTGKMINRTLLRSKDNRLPPKSSDQSNLYELALKEAQALLHEHEHEHEQVIFIQHSGYMVANKL